jgi:hypothetical protein
MARPIGSKNKPKTTDSASVKTPVKSAVQVSNVKTKLDLLTGDSELLKPVKDSNIKITYDKTTKVLLSETSGQDSFKLFDDMKESNPKYEEFKRFYKEGHDDFLGGSYQEIKDSANGKFPIEEFLKTRDKIKKTLGNLDFLEAELSRKRSRFMSEHDGEMDFDRLYEREPFHNTKILNNGITRVMDINVAFCFSAGVNARQINEYGALCWSVIDILEKSGIRCNVNLVHNATNISKGAETVNLYSTIIKIKSCEDYIDTNDIARHFVTNYYRRVIFAHEVAISEALGRTINYGLGSPLNHDKERQSSKQKGVINLDITQTQDFKLDNQKLVEYIRNAL